MREKNEKKFWDMEIIGNRRKKIVLFFNKSILSFFQNETLSPNEEEGILINEFSLVLQNVGHHSIGKYMCMATNDAGKGSSQQVFLDVKCKQYG